MAPMAGITDRPFRALTASFGGGNIVSEMVAVNALERKNAKTCRIADVRDEPYPVVVQLVGGDPALFAEAAKLAARPRGAQPGHQHGLSGKENRQQQFRFGTDERSAAGGQNHRNDGGSNPA